MEKSKSNGDPFFTTSIEDSLNILYEELMKDLGNIAHGEKTKLHGYLQYIHIPGVWCRHFSVYITSISGVGLKIEIEKSGLFRSKKKIVAELTPEQIIYHKYKKIPEFLDFFSKFENKMVKSARNIN